MFRDDVEDKLREFLYKLGIKSAEIAWHERILRSSMDGFGKPDQLIVHPEAYAAFKKLTEKKNMKLLIITTVLLTVTSIFTGCVTTSGDQQGYRAFDRHDRHHRLDP